MIFVLKKGTPVYVRLIALASAFFFGIGPMALLLDGKATPGAVLVGVVFGLLCLCFAFAPEARR